MLATIKSNKKFIGASWGGFVASIGSVIFAFTEMAVYANNNSLFIRENPRLFTSLIAFTMLVSWLYALFPGMIGGYSLACISQGRKIRGWLSPKKGFFIGALMGLFIGIALCIIPTLFTRSEGNNDTVALILLFRIIKVLLITSLASGWTGWKLAHEDGIL